MKLVYSSLCCENLASVPLFFFTFSSEMCKVASLYLAHDCVLYFSIHKHLLAHIYLPFNLTQPLCCIFMENTHTRLHISLIQNIGFSYIWFGCNLRNMSWLLYICHFIVKIALECALYFIIRILALPLEGSRIWSNSMMNCLWYHTPNAVCAITVLAHALHLTLPRLGCYTCAWASFTARQYYSSVIIPYRRKIS